MLIRHAILAAAALTLGRVRVAGPRLPTRTPPGQEPSPAAAAIAGCWRVAHSDGAALPSYSGFWAGPVRLDTARLAPGRARQLAGPGGRAIRPTARIPRRAAIDTVLTVSFWAVVRPDSVILRRTDGFVGQLVRLRVTGDSLVGSAMSTSDVAEHRTARRVPVVVRRARCPAPRGHAPGA